MFKLNSSTVRSIFPAISLLFLGGALAATRLAAQQAPWTPNPASRLHHPGKGEQGEPYTVFKPASSVAVNEALRQSLPGRLSTDAAASSTLPLWFYNVTSSRDGNGYFGIMVGNDPFNTGGTANVPTYVIPLMITTNTVGVAYTSSTGLITTAPGTTVFDPTAPDTACLADPNNNVPATIFAQSPIFQNASFNFGGTDLGYTQYLDAFQRANFWGAWQNSSDYHVLLNPMTVLPAVSVNVPAAYGTTRPVSSTSRTPCGPLGIVDINWLDNYLTSVVLPSLASQGVSAASLPVFQLYNVVEASPVTNLRSCCILGYHGWVAPPLQTYAVADFDTSNFYPPSAQDTAVLSHEIGEWINDPVGYNFTPLWGHTGQVSGCQANLEVGDPLTGTLAPSVFLNGFTYHLQEMAFYSWFLGGPSIGVNGWYSNNASFIRDAGPPCH
ncbi:MAG TPA: hypothetical protein VFB14_06580 [Bryobacteraceae bacterium]|jgi:hypothetical protein|nr:hypothetical protein [Bryobacteraceae bacterium]